MQCRQRQCFQNFSLGSGDDWHWRISLPERKPFREAKLRIDPEGQGKQPDRRLLQLLADAFEARQLVLSNPELSINQLAAREARCRKQLGKLVRLSWLSPRIVEAVAGGTQLKSLSRRALLNAELPIEWSEQEALLGFVG